jgi:hypothetical protein
MSEEINSLIPQEVLDSFGIISPKDIADFMRAFEYVIHLTSGKTVTEAAAAIGIPRRTVYNARWRDFINKASIILRERTSQDVAQVASYVHDEWPSIIKSIVAVAKGPELKLRTDAARFLYEAYIEPYQDQIRDTSSEEQYLKTKRDFNPAQKLLEMLDEGTTITISAETPKTIDG